VDLGIEGRVALVTAASRGLGFASAQALAAEGASVVICARAEDRLTRAEKELRDQGAQVHAVVADVADPGTPERLVGRPRELRTARHRGGQRRRPTSGWSPGGR
jgi:NAD(P)-dependent dehydrogenase (short-subunit alcohol dehydrogenase family)